MARNDRTGTDELPIDPRFSFQPGKTVIFSIIFTVLVMWQSGFPWYYAIPIWFFVWAVFILAHSFYNWANLKLIQVGRRNKDKMEEMERQDRERKKNSSKGPGSNGGKSGRNRKR